MKRDKSGRFVKSKSKGGGKPKRNTEEENRIIQILNDTLSSLASQYEDYKRYSDTNPTIRLYRETETLILKAIKK